MLRRDAHEANRLSWNEATRAHNSHKRDQARFLRGGGSTLFPEEVELLGDLRGRTLAHLQCNAGQDTLSMVHLGAQVTGVDISDEAIAFAQQLAHDAGLAAAFVRADVYDWLATTAASQTRYDVVFSSYGALCWLSDLKAWAKGVAGVLAPRGRLVVIEFHPFSMIFDEQFKPVYPYATSGEVLPWPEGIGDYVAAAGGALSPSGHEAGVEGFRNPCPSHEFGWGIGDILTAVLEAGLAITTFREYPYANGCKLYQGMRELPGRRMVPPEGFPNIPLMYGLVAQARG